MKIRHLQLVTHEHSDTIGKRENVLPSYGPVNPALTTSLAQKTRRENQLRQLSELLNSLESVVENLNYKSFTVYDTLITAIQGVRVALSDIATEEAGTDTL